MPQDTGRGKFVAMPAGRPSEYDPAFAKQAQKLCELGATDQELADFFDVDVRTIYRWKHNHDEFCQALKSGKAVCDERVERSLYQRAIGYEQEEVKIFMPANAANPVYAPYRAKVAPDVTAAIFWLKNRRSQDWRDRKDIDHTSSDGSMTPKGFDASGLSTQTLRELMAAKNAPDA